MRILVTGGAGYIGSHIVRLLAERGDEPVIVDDFSTGRADRVEGHPSLHLDLAGFGAREELAGFMLVEGVDAVIHLAARKKVAESMQHPQWYYRQNVGGVDTVLGATADLGLRNVVFSSSAAVYGDAAGTVTEDHPKAPINPYGQTKLIGEWMSASAARTEKLRAVALRYFNVAGTGWPELADTAVQNLIPIVLDAYSRGEAPQIFGDDYATADGTCVRDYIHVLDLAEAHLAVLDSLHGQSESFRVYNVGTGVGSSVRDVVEGLQRRVAGAPEPVIQGRRDGDPAMIVADPSRIAAELGWTARFGLDDILDSAVSASVPDGD